MAGNIQAPRELSLLTRMDVFSTAEVSRPRYTDARATGSPIPSLGPTVPPSPDYSPEDTDLRGTGSTSWRNWYPMDRMVEFGVDMPQFPYSLTVH